MSPFGYQLMQGFAREGACGASIPKAISLACVWLGGSNHNVWQEQAHSNTRCCADSWHALQLHHGAIQTGQGGGTTLYLECISSLSMYLVKAQNIHININIKLDSQVKCMCL